MLTLEAMGEHNRSSSIAKPGVILKVPQRALHGLGDTVVWLATSKRVRPQGS